MGLYQLSKPHTFVLGSDYHKADVEISTTLARIIERASLMKTPGAIWMSAPYGVYEVAIYDGKGGVFNGSNALTKASPEQILLLVDVLWSRGELGMPTNGPEIGGPSFCREHTVSESAVMPEAFNADGSVRVCFLSGAMRAALRPEELMSVGELVNQMKQLLTEKSSPHWEKLLMNRIEALAIAAVSAPAIKAA